MMMTKTLKGIAQVVGVLVVVAHIAALIKDVERCKANLDQFVADPSLGNLASVVFAEGVLVEDLGLA